LVVRKLYRLLHEGGKEVGLEKTAVVVLLTVLLATPAFGQNSSSSVVDCEAPAAQPGVLVVSFVPHDPEFDGKLRLVRLDGSGPPLSNTCIASLDRVSRSGVVTFQNVDPGHYWLVPVGYKIQGDRTPVSVSAGDTLRMSVPFRTENGVLECLAAQACSQILTIQTSTEIKAETEEARVRGIALRTAAAMAIGPAETLPRMSLCVTEEAADYVMSLREVFPRVRMADSCEVREGRIRSMSTLIDPQEGIAARRITVSNLDRRNPAEYTVRVGYWQGPLNAAGWDCVIRKTDGVWAPSSCILVWIS
jgi:hypothetical protein